MPEPRRACASNSIATSIVAQVFVAKPIREGLQDADRLASYRPKRGCGARLYYDQPDGSPAVELTQEPSHYLFVGDAIKAPRLSSHAELRVQRAYCRRATTAQLVSDQPCRLGPRQYSPSQSLGCVRRAHDKPRPACVEHDALIANHQGGRNTARTPHDARRRQRAQLVYFSYKASKSPSLKDSRWSGFSRSSTRLNSRASGP
jgi:hypothetical protein